MRLTVADIKSIPFVFIVGRGRSGTTLLQTMIDANAGALIPYESRLLLFLKQKYFKVQRFTPALLEQFISDLYLEKKFVLFWQVPRQKLRELILSYDPATLDFATLCKLVYLSYSSQFEKRRIILLGDKNPIYSLFIDELLEVFPEARFVHLVRDHRDNIVSNREAFESRHVGQLAIGWLNYNLAIEQAKKKHPLQFCTVRYEDLVEDPVTEMKRICAFTKVEFDPGMLEAHKKVHKIADATRKSYIHAIFPNMLNPINKNSVNRWMNAMTTSELALANTIAGELALRYGYANTIASERISFFILAKIRWKYRYWLFVVKAYYHSPMWIRKILVSFSDKLFRWFKITHAFNRVDVAPPFKKRVSTIA